MKIPFNKIDFSEDTQRLVVETLKSGWIASGPKTIELENLFKNSFCRKYAVATNSATAGLHLALVSLNLHKGDKVVVPVFTFTSTASVVEYCGLEVVFCDIEGSTYNICYKNLEKLLIEDDQKKIKAVIVVHVAGNAVDMCEILRLKKIYGFTLIEDAAHCLPGTFDGKKLGSFGEYAIFSFNPTKNIPGADGGMIILDNSERYLNIKKLKSYGIDRDAWTRGQNKNNIWEYDISDLGFKYNGNDISSAIVLSQMKDVESIHLIKIKLVLRYYELLSTYSWIKFSFDFSSNHEKLHACAWHLLIVRVDKRNDLHSFLLSNDIATLVHYKPLHLHSYWRNKLINNTICFPVSELAFNEVLSLPLYPSMKIEEVDYVCLKIIEFYEHKSPGDSLDI